MFVIYFYADLFFMVKVLRQPPIDFVNYHLPVVLFPNNICDIKTKY